MMTIEEYASKWAVVEHRAVMEHDCNDFSSPSRQEIFYQWAVADKDSPIYWAILAGQDQMAVKEKFDTAYEQMLTLLERFDD